MSLETNHESFTQTSGETNIEWTLLPGPNGEAVLNAEGSHFNQSPILSLLTGGNGKPALDMRLPPDFNGNVTVRVGGVVKYQIVDGVEQ